MFFEQKFLLHIATIHPAATGIAHVQTHLISFQRTIILLSQSIYVIEIFVSILGSGSQNHYWLLFCGNILEKWQYFGYLATYNLNLCGKFRNFAKQWQVIQVAYNRDIAFDLLEEKKKVRLILYPGELLLGL